MKGHEHKSLTEPALEIALRIARGEGKLRAASGIKTILDELGTEPVAAAGFTGNGDGDDSGGTVPPSPPPHG